MEHDLEKNARKMRLRVYEHMLKTRGWKYRAFLRYLRLFKYLSFSRTRGELLESYYTLMRYLDDVVDGDFPVPAGYKDSAEYLQEKISFSEIPDNPADEVDFLMLHCFTLAKRLEEDYHPEVKDILDSLLFDAKRRGKLIIFPAKELRHHFHVLDIRGTVRATLKVFREDPEKFRILEPLGMATRYQFDLEDFESDIKAGYVNISREDCKLFEIRPEDLQNQNSPGVRRWFLHHAREGMDLLAEHHRQLPGGKFSFLARAAFSFVYEYPARKLFRKILSESEGLNFDA